MTAPRLTSLARAAALAALAALGLAACDREDRRFRENPPSAPPGSTVRLSALQPGPAVTSVRASNPYDNNAYASSEGQRLYGWYNCAGCHANGGGGMGPPLMDDRWIYGSAPENIYATIVEGRPNGMPSFGGRIPSSQIWQIVSYVRSMSALTPMASRSARTEHMMATPGAASLEHPKPAVHSFTPPAAEMP